MRNYSIVQTLNLFSTQRSKIMKLLQPWMSITLLIVLCSTAVAQTNTPRPPSPGQGNRAPNSPRHDQVVVEFPGHKYAMEIAVKPIKEKVNGEERTIPAVCAYVTDSHFEPLRVDANELRLNFTIEKKPKSFILLPVKADAGKDQKSPSVFESKDSELVKLISDGWQGNATAAMSVGRTPFNAKLVKAKDYKPHNH
jgi:hypothetical protein